MLKPRITGGIDLNNPSEPSNPVPIRRTAFRSWLATLGLGVVAAVAGQIPALAVLSWSYGDEFSLAKLQGMAGNGEAVIILVCVSTPVQLGLLFWFARRRSSSALNYLALNLPKKGHILRLFLAAAALFALGDGVNWLLGGRIVTPFQIDIYRSAERSGALPWLWLTVVIVAPIGEETLFRGFLFQGWRRSPNDAWAAIGATALLWALVHVQYNPLIIGQIFVVGLALGWVRWTTGSTISTIFLHALLNSVGLAETHFALRG
jgi:uncharacterized protein